MKEVKKKSESNAIYILAGFVFLAFLISAVFSIASAETRIGGSGSLSRSNLGQPSSIGELFSHLTRGGRTHTDDSTDEGSNTGGDISTDQQNGQNGQDGDSPSGVDGGSSNGGVTAGNGGDGGNGGGASDGGLIRAGSAFSNSSALNLVNVTVVRITFNN